MSSTDQIKTYVAKRINSILANPSESAARSSLAKLRRGIGHMPGELPELWGEYLLDLPEELMGRGSNISRAEWAIYTTLTLFALHQQGKDRASQPMHQQNISLGTAANRLIKNENDDRERISRRFYPVAMASDMAELSHHLRGLITLMRSQGISMDYIRLSGDLYNFQDPDRVDAVRLRWGEDFCRIYNDKENNTEEEN